MLKELQNILQTLGVSVLVDEVMPIKIPDEGLLIIRDEGTPEITTTLSPLRNYYQHRVSLEVLSLSRKVREALVAGAIQAIEANPTLWETVDYCCVTGFDASVEPVEGGRSLYLSQINLTIER